METELPKEVIKEYMGNSEALKSIEEKLKIPLEKTNQLEKLQIEIDYTEAYARSEFTSQQNEHLNNSLRFADAKAGALVTVNGLVLTYVTALIDSSSGYSAWFFKASLVTLIIGIVWSIAVVYPKSLNSKDKGLVYWGHIRNYKKEEFALAILEGDVNTLFKNSIENNYTQAIILTKKFKQLEISFKAFILAYTAIAVGLILNFFV
ncbi:hypothetical protein L1279_000508 [Planomicrobium sp. HSC-17F08]|nr:hypothetical protein [Planomicrobium sp. HSC-17F08]